MNKTQFLKCLQGMQLGVPVEDLISFFNFIDDRNENIISKLQFIDSLTSITSKLGPASRLD